MAAEPIAYLPSPQFGSTRGIARIGRHVADYFKLRDAARSLLVG